MCNRIDKPEVSEVVLYAYDLVRKVVKCSRGLCTRVKRNLNTLLVQTLRKLYEHIQMHSECEP
jgi:hypothetical protein